MRSTRRGMIWGLVAAFVTLACACKDTASRLTDIEGSARRQDPVVEFTILQLNDVYEIAAVEGGQSGGLARVATLLKRLRAENPNTVAVLAGDFLNPSAIGATQLNGKAVAGEQMVDVLNAMGLDFVTIGNHEFDNGEAVLNQRIGESRFKWIVSNVFDGGGKPFANTIENTVLTFRNRQGVSARLGLIGVCLDFAKKPWLSYKTPIDSAREQVSKLSGRADVLVALTHLTMAEDKNLAAAVPELEILMGGHEHEHVDAVAGEDKTPIYKADANAKTVYVHRFRYDTAAKRLAGVKSELVAIDSKIPDDPAVSARVKDWTDRVYAALKAAGINPEDVVGQAREVLEGQESAVRNRPTNLTQLIAEAFADAAPEADAVIYGSGSIRIDDRLMAGKITTFDVLRIFPFGGNTILVEIPGKVLQATLEQGDKNVGSGGYLVRAHVTKDAAGKWLVKGQPLAPEKSYKVLFNDFLLTGMEKGLSYLSLTAEGTEVKKIRDTPGVRDLFIARLKKDMATKGGSP